MMMFYHLARSESDDLCDVRFLRVLAGIKEIGSHRRLLSYNTMNNVIRQKLHHLKRQNDECWLLKCGGRRPVICVGVLQAFLA